MKQADAVLQEIWQIKDDAFKAAGLDSKRFVADLQARSTQLRQGLRLRPLNVQSQAPRLAIKLSDKG